MDQLDPPRRSPERLDVVPAAPFEDPGVDVDGHRPVRPAAPDPLARGVRGAAEVLAQVPRPAPAQLREGLVDEVDLRLHALHRLLVERVDVGLRGHRVLAASWSALPGHGRTRVGGTECPRRGDLAHASRDRSRPGAVEQQFSLCPRFQQGPHAQRCFPGIAGVPPASGPEAHQCVQAGRMPALPGVASAGRVDLPGERQNGNCCCARRATASGGRREPRRRIRKVIPSPGNAGFHRTCRISCHANVFIEYGCVPRRHARSPPAHSGRRAAPASTGRGANS